MFNRAAPMTLNGIFLMVTWIAYYELDAIYIGHVFGVREVAIYSVGFSILSLTRSMFAILFSPLSTRLVYFMRKGIDSS